MRMIAAASVVLGMFGLVSACSKHDQTTVFAEGDWRNEMSTVRIGLRASEDDAFKVRRWEVFQETLSEVTGLPVKVFEASDYNGIIQAIASDQIDLASFGPGSYANVYAQVGDDVTPILATRESTGVMGYYSGIVVRADTPYQSIEDLEGQPLAFVDFNSTSGYIYPRWKMRQAGIEPDTFFSESAMAGGHLQSVMAMQNGQFDAAVVSLSRGTPEYGFRGGSIFRMARLGLVDINDFRIIWAAGPIPRSPMAVRTDRPQEFKDLLRGAIASLAFDQPEVIAEMGRMPGSNYAAVDHAYYQEIVDIRAEEIKEQRMRFARRTPDEPQGSRYASATQ